MAHPNLGSAARSPRAMQQWFPDRPGLATGLAIMGFGGGALIASPLSNSLLSAYADTPADAIAPAFLTLGAIYFVIMMLGAGLAIGFRVARGL